jgi:hypothetical protein
MVTECNVYNNDTQWSKGLRSKLLTPNVPREPVPDSLRSSVTPAIGYWLHFDVKRN